MNIRLLLKLMTLIIVFSSISAVSLEVDFPQQKIKIFKSTPKFFRSDYPNYQREMVETDNVLTITNKFPDSDVGVSVNNAFGEQDWLWNPVDNTIRPLNKGEHCLSIKNYQDNSGLAISLCQNGSNEQKWTLSQDGTIHPKIAPGGVQYCLNLANDNLAHRVDLYTCNGHKSQQWRTTTNSIIKANLVERGLISKIYTEQNNGITMPDNMWVSLQYTGGADVSGFAEITFIEKIAPADTSFCVYDTGGWGNGHYVCHSEGEASAIKDFDDATIKFNAKITSVSHLKPPNWLYLFDEKYFNGNFQIYRANSLDLDLENWSDRAFSLILGKKDPKRYNIWIKDSGSDFIIKPSRNTCETFVICNEMHRNNHHDATESSWFDPIGDFFEDTYDATESAAITTYDFAAGTLGDLPNMPMGVTVPVSIIEDGVEIGQAHIRDGVMVAITATNEVYVIVDGILMSVVDFIKAVKINTSLIAIIEGGDRVPVHQTTSPTTNGSNWMAELPDQQTLGRLTIPGTHDSATGAFHLQSTASLASLVEPILENLCYENDCVKLPADFVELFIKVYLQNGLLVETQYWTIAEQLDNGIRFLDVRVGDYKSEGKEGFAVYHGAIEVGDFNSDVMTPVNEFLQLHPQEVILMSISDDSPLTKTKFHDQVLKNDNNPFVFASPSTKLGDVRGKIVFFNRMKNIDTAGGIDWKDASIVFSQDEYNNEFTCDFEDFYDFTPCWSDHEKKKNYIQAHFEEANKDKKSEIFYVNFTTAQMNLNGNATGLDIVANATEQNAKINSLYSAGDVTKTLECSGSIILMDYPAFADGLTDNVVITTLINANLNSLSSCSESPTELSMLDSDNDLIPNGVDMDDDGDGINDTGDNCPLIANLAQQDFDNDGIGNVCDEIETSDFNRDYCIARDDYQILMAVVRARSAYNSVYDLNDDGVVNIADVRYLTRRFTNYRGGPCI